MYDCVKELDPDRGLDKEHQGPGTPNHSMRGIRRPLLTGSLPLFGRLILSVEHTVRKSKSMKHHLGIFKDVIFLT